MSVPTPKSTPPVTSVTPGSLVSPLEGEQPFPILRSSQCLDTHPGWPTSIPYHFVQLYARQLRINHGYDVDRLANRGGLSLVELWLAVWDKRPQEAVEYPGNVVALEHLSHVVSAWRLTPTPTTVVTPL